MVKREASPWTKVGDILGMGRTMVVSLGLFLLSPLGSGFPITAGGQVLFLPPKSLTVFFAWLVGVGWLPSIASSFFCGLKYSYIHTTI